MDIKDFILIGGGLLIAAVVAHGFWIAWRDKRHDLRIDIKPDLIPDEVDEIDRLRGELPNGGARVIKADYVDPQQDLLELEEPPPLLLEPSEGPPASSRRIEPELPSGGTARNEPKLSDGGGRNPAIGQFEDDDPLLTRTGGRTVAGGPGESGRVAASRAKVTEVALPEPIVADEPRRPRRLGQRRESSRPVAEKRTAVEGRSAEKREIAPAAPPVEELIVVNVLSDVNALYTGDELFTTLRTCGLKFGDMNIFHRVEPLTRAVQYSVASAVEPGTFDMAEMEAIRCPGLCLFMQLPGPEDPSAAFEDMLSVARSVIRSLGGEIKDEHRNVMTPQTVEHYRQRIVDFSRRRMSKRA